MTNLLKSVPPASTHVTEQLRSLEFAELRPRLIRHARLLVRDTGMNRVIWCLLRSFIYARRGRMPPAKLSAPVWYFAYGSNMNERLFRERRHMTPIETRIGVLSGYKLVFTSAGGAQLGTLCTTLARLWRADREGPQGVFLQPIARLLARKTTQWTARARAITDRRELCRGSLGISAPANIVEDASSKVHGVLYRLPLRKFARLDNSEGRQYSYLWTDIEDQAGNRLPAVTYRVRRSLGAEGKPGKQYMTLIRDAARERRLPQNHIDFLDAIEVRE